MTEQDPPLIPRLSLMGLAITVVLVGGVGGGPLRLGRSCDRAGTIVVETNVKVQHPTGGVVGGILREGGPVEAGQVVLRLDDTSDQATLGVVRSERES